MTIKEDSNELSYSCGYNKAVDDIMQIMDNASDDLEALYSVKRYIIKHKTGIDIGEIK